MIQRRRMILIVSVCAIGAMLRLAAPSVAAAAELDEGAAKTLLTSALDKKYYPSLPSG
jgi:hypothetical protein